MASHSRHTDFDLLSPPVLRDPHAFWQSARDDRVFYYETMQCWVLTRRDDVARALGDWRTFSSHTLRAAPLSADAREDKRALGQVFIDFIAARLRRELPTLSRSEAAHHGQVALMIFRGILDEFTTASPSARTRLQQAMRDAILRYLTPVLTESKAGRAVARGTR